MDGKVLKGDSLPTESNWVLVYVRPDCRACDAILGELGGRKYGGPPPSAPNGAGKQPRTVALNAERQGSYFVRLENASRKVLVIVGGADVEGVRRMAAANPWVPQGSWYADTSGQLAAKLGLQGAPVIAGVKDGSVKWSYTGVPPKGLPLRSLMSAWHEQREPQAPSAKAQAQGSAQPKQAAPKKQ